MEVLADEDGSSGRYKLNEVADAAALHGKAWLSEVVA